MYPGDDPRSAPQTGADPFGAPPPVFTNTTGYGAPTGFGAPPPRQSDFNTFAMLSPIFGVVLPPAGVVLGHLALPQIRRTGERGREVAVVGLTIGYLMCVVLVALLVWWLVSDADSGTAAPTSLPDTSSETSSPRPRPSVVTSVAPPVQPQRIKVDLATVPLGTCVEIQRRSTERADALDLFRVDCERRAGVFTVADRVASDAQCNSVFVAAPPDRSLAVCLNPY